MAGPEKRTAMLAGLAAPDRRLQHLGMAGFGPVVTVLGLCAGACAGLSSADLFLSNPLVGLLSAFTAVLFGLPYLAAILWLDRNEREPWWLVASALAWGAVFATGWSLFFNDLFLGFATGLVGDPALARQ